MTKIEILCQSYLAARSASAHKAYQEQFDAMYGFLRFRLSPDDFLEAESLLNELLAVVQKESFCIGIAYLPQLWAELLED